MDFRLSQLKRLLLRLGSGEAWPDAPPGLMPPSSMVVSSRGEERLLVALLCSNICDDSTPAIKKKSAKGAEVVSGGIDVGAMSIETVNA